MATKKCAQEQDLPQAESKPKEEMERPKYLNSN
jgi:hypothetical protein